MQAAGEGLKMQGKGGGGELLAVCREREDGEWLPTTGKAWVGKGC